jgi:uncharacterized membrane protein
MSSIALQCTYRYAVSTRQLKALKLQQRDLSAVCEERDRLRSAVQKLRDELDDTRQNLSRMVAKSAEIDILRKEKGTGSITAQRSSISTP